MKTRVYRILRSMIQWCVEHRVKVVLATVGVFALSILAFGPCPSSSSSPLSERRPELFPAVAACPKARRFKRHRKLRQEGGSTV